MIREGVLTAGNLIVDHVKVIDRWPAQGMLSNVLEEIRSTGGGPSNVAIDLAKLRVNLPIFVAGLVGDDSDGDFVVERLRSNAINVDSVSTTDEAATSFTDVMTNQQGGQRTFFHFRGANSLLSPEALNRVQTSARIFHLGYLLLLDSLDEPDDEFGVAAARVLEAKSAEGYKVSVDVVSENSERFLRVVTPCLPHIDYLIFNEIEAGRSTGMEIRNPDGQINVLNLRTAARRLLDGGVRELVAIHFPEGGFVRVAGGKEYYHPSFRVPEEEFRGAAGAGDAFCAGLLYSLHESLDFEYSLALANASARFNLTNPTCSDGAVPLDELERFLAGKPEQTPILDGLETLNV